MPSDFISWWNSLGPGPQVAFVSPFVAGIFGILIALIKERPYIALGVFVALLLFAVGLFVWPKTAPATDVITHHDKISSPNPTAPVAALPKNEVQSALPSPITPKQTNVLPSQPPQTYPAVGLGWVYLGKFDYNGLWTQTFVNLPVELSDHLPKSHTRYSLPVISETRLMPLPDFLRQKEQMQEPWS